MSSHAAKTGDNDSGRAEADAYQAYLKSISRLLPPATREFAVSEWYYSDPEKCPHDAWLESCEIFETFSGERHEVRNVGIKLRLLSSFHTGHIHFTYDDVFRYELGFAPRPRLWDNKLVPPRHEDWLTDKISLAPDGHVIHEIHFSSGCTWRIESASVAYEFVGIPGRQLPPEYTKNRP